MKRILLSLVAIMAFGFANAQEGNFKVGAHVGLPLGDFKDSFSVNLGVDVAYLWKVADKFSAGVTTGYTTFLAKTYTYNDGFTSFELKVMPQDLFQLLVLLNILLQIIYLLVEI